MALLQELQLPEGAFICEHMGRVVLRQSIHDLAPITALEGILKTDALDQDSQEYHALGLEDVITEETAQALLGQIRAKTAKGHEST